MPVGQDTPEGLSSRIATLRQVLSSYDALCVPRYQRGYSWTPTEVGRLLLDLRLAISRNARYYFIGPVVLVGAGAGEAEIVDGQQRLATLSILLAYLRDRCGREEAQGLQRLIAARRAGGLRLRASDQEFFRQYVHTQGAIEKLANLQRTETDAQGLLAAAAQCIRDTLSGFTEEELAALQRFLLDRVVFSVIESDDRDGASLLFRVLNDRGRDLSDAAIIKSELLEAARLEEGEAESAAQQWDALEERLGRDQFEKLLDMSPLIVSGNLREAPGDLAAFRRDVLQAVDPYSFLREDMPRYADAIERIERREVEAGPHTAEVKRRLACLAMLKEVFWLPAAVAYIADHQDAHDDTLQFFKQIERLAFVCTLGVIRPEKRFERFAQVVRARGRSDMLYGPRGALELSDAERRQVRERINEPFQRDRKLRRLIAFRVNAALGEALDLTGPFTVEHVLPARASGVWLKNFPNADERETLTHLIGNWALISNNDNTAAADKPFAAKREVYFRNGSRDVCALTADIFDHADWTPTVIRLRQENLVARLCADWNLLARKSGCR